MRKIATAARVTTIIEPAKTAVPENHRSPGRRLAAIRGERRRWMLSSHSLW